MTQLNRRMNPGILPSLALLLVTGSASLVTFSTSTSATTLQDSKQDWSQRVWDSAKNSQYPGLDQLRASFDAIPGASFDKELLEHFRFFDTRNRENEVKANKVRDDAHAEAYEEMLEAQSDESLSLALLAAVKAQTFSEDYNSAFDDAKIQEVIAWAERDIPVLEENGDWSTRQGNQNLARNIGWKLLK